VDRRKNLESGLVNREARKILHAGEEEREDVYGNVLNTSKKGKTAPPDMGKSLSFGTVCRS